MGFSERLDTVRAADLYFKIVMIWNTYLHVYDDRDDCCSDDTGLGR